MLNSLYPLIKIGRDDSDLPHQYTGGSVVGRVSYQVSSKMRLVVAVWPNGAPPSCGGRGIKERLLLQ